MRDTALDKHTDKVNKIILGIMISGDICSFLFVVLGLFHYTAVIALTTGAIISSVMLYKKASNNTIRLVQLTSVTITLSIEMLSIPDASLALASVLLGISAMYLKKEATIAVGFITCLTVCYQFFIGKEFEFVPFLLYIVSLLFVFAYYIL